MAPKFKGCVRCLCDIVSQLGQHISALKRPISVLGRKALLMGSMESGKRWLDSAFRAKSICFREVNCGPVILCNNGETPFF